MAVTRVPLDEDGWADLDPDKMTIRVRNDYWRAYAEATPVPHPTAVLGPDGQPVTRPEALVINGKVQVDQAGEPVTVDVPIIDPGEHSGQWLLRESAGWNVMLAHMIVGWSLDRPTPDGDVSKVEDLPADVGNRLQAWCLHNRKGLMPDFSLTQESFDDPESPTAP